MENILTILYLDDINIIIYFLKTFLMGLCIYYTFAHILNIKPIFNIKCFFVFFFTLIIAYFDTKIRSNSFTHSIFFVLSLSILYYMITTNKLGYTILVTVASFSLNKVVYFFSIIIDYIFNAIFGVQNDLVNLILIYIIHFILLCFLFNIKRFKKGFTFLKKDLNNEYFDLLISGISTIVLFSSTLINKNYSMDLRLSVSIIFIILAIIMFITIRTSLTLYYKHSLLVKDLNETKAELDKKNLELEKLEKENLEFSKTSHSIAHKQRALEYKLNQLMMKNEIADELDISDRIKEVSAEFFDNKVVAVLPKTEISEIDDMLEFMQSECINNNIDFELQLNGNIHHMVNTFIPKETLQILLADHIKNSIIAINNSDNVNRSILVKLGLIDNYYSLYVYDSGIEFESDTLKELGKKPITTHADSGGTGFGFMNTFDTLKKYKASLIINELNPPCKDNYTKVIVIKFDNKNEFIVDSYRTVKTK